MANEWLVLDIDEKFLGWLGGKTKDEMYVNLANCHGIFDGHPAFAVRVGTMELVKI